MKVAQKNLKHKGRRLIPPTSLKRVNKAYERLQRAQLIKGSSKALFPIVCSTTYNPVPKVRKMEFNDEKVSKMRVVRLYVNTIQDPNHPFVGKTKDWLKTQVEKELVGIQLNCGVDFDVDLFDKVRKQTFMYSKDDEIKVGNKVRMLILFENEETAAMGFAVLNAARSKSLPWRVYVSRLNPEKVYVESEMISLIVQWLCGLELDEVTYIPVTISNTILSSFGFTICKKSVFFY